jgi:hypothetical protein
MLETLIWIVIGMFIGWAIPQPEWAQDLQDRVKDFFGSR